MMSSRELEANALEVGKTYRGKRRHEGRYNDRTILWIGGGLVQYDSLSVRFGAKYPSVPIEKFLRWASHEIKEEANEEQTD